MARATKTAPAASKRAAQVDDVIEEVDSGPSLETGLVLTTTLLLIGAIVLVALAYQRYAG